MAKQKFDGVIESVRYGEDGNITWVRAYERRGPTFSDWVLIDRPALVERLRAGKKFVVGKRVPFLSSTFETQAPVRLVEKDGAEVVMVGEGDESHDSLADVLVV